MKRTSRAVEAGSRVHSSCGDGHVAMELQERLPGSSIVHALEVLAGEAGADVVLEYVGEDGIVPREPTRDRLVRVVGPFACVSPGRADVERRLCFDEAVLLRRRRYSCCAVGSVHEVDVL